MFPRTVNIEPYMYILDVKGVKSMGHLDATLKHRSYINSSTSSMAIQ